MSVKTTFSSQKYIEKMVKKGYNRITLYKIICDLKIDLSNVKEIKRILKKIKKYQ